jgi:hypothetical protein
MKSAKPTAMKPCASTGAKGDLPAVYYQLHALLQTLRALASHEDDVCALLAHVQRTGRMPASARRELEALLDSLPALALEGEMSALWAELEQKAA